MAVGRAIGLAGERTARRAIGLMSGTSHDGIDVALLETDGERIFSFGPTGYRPYSDSERGLLREAFAAATTLADRSARPGLLAAAEDLVTTAHAIAVATFLGDNGLTPADIDVVGFHGQTVLHRPERRLTVQIGDGAALARRLGIPVVYDFRAADVAAGGQGAPLVPVFHRALADTVARPRPLAVLNLGGVANVTFVGRDDGQMLACDTGPGNALIDDFLRARTGAPFDAGGALAAKGRVDEAVVATVLGHPFFAAPVPKSLDRDDFRRFLALLEHHAVEDGAATLAAITARSVAAVVPHLPAPPAGWILAGGGVRNGTLVSMLEEVLAPAPVETANGVGWSADSLEAQAFAYLAVRSLEGLPLTFPGTTGVPAPLAGGVLCHPPSEAGAKARASA